MIAVEDAIPIPQSPIFRILMPLPYKKFTTFEGPTWYFDEGLFLDTIYDEDFMSFLRDEPSDFYKASVNIDTKCIYADITDTDEFRTITKNIAVPIKYILNTFSAGTPVIIPFSALIEIDDFKKAHIRDIYDLEPITNLHDLREQVYSIREDVEQAAISSYFKIVKKCCTTNPPLLFTLDRFCSSLSRRNFQDKIVDISISLESLIQSTQELSFRFSLYNSFIATQSANDRANAYELFLKLYDARSKIVHGDTMSKASERKINFIINNWQEIQRLARASLNYYLLFLDQHDRNEWDQHLKDLVLNKVERIVE